MYNQEDFNDIKKQIKRTLIIVLGIFTVFLIISIFLKGKVNETLAVVVLILGVCIDIYIWGMYGSQYIAYYRYLRDLFTGRSRTIEAVVKDISKEPVYKDIKLFFYEVMVEEEGVERMLLFDNNKNMPKLEPGKKYKFEIHENYIKDVAV